MGKKKALNLLSMVNYLHFMYKYGKKGNTNTCRLNY